MSLLLLSIKHQSCARRGNQFALALLPPHGIIVNWRTLCVWYSYTQRAFKLRCWLPSRTSYFFRLQLNARDWFHHKQRSIKVKAQEACQVCVCRVCMRPNASRSQCVTLSFPFKVSPVCLCVGANTSINISLFSSIQRQQISLLSVCVHNGGNMLTWAE